MSRSTGQVEPAFAILTTVSKLFSYKRCPVHLLQWVVNCHFCAGTWHFILYAFVLLIPGLPAHVLGMFSGYCWSFLHDPQDLFICLRMTVLIVHMRVSIHYSINGQASSLSWTRWGVVRSSMCNRPPCWIVMLTWKPSFQIKPSVLNMDTFSVSSFPKHSTSYTNQGG